MLKTMRTKAGISQRRLSDISGVHYRTIQELEKNMENKDWYRNLVALSKALDCSMDDLLKTD